MEQQLKQVQSYSGAAAEAD